MSPPTNTGILEKLDQMLEQQDILTEALLGSPRPGSPPGLIRRMDESERDRSDLRRLLSDLTSDVRALQAAPGKAAMSWWDRAGLALLGLVLSAIGAMVGATLKGQHP